MSEISEAINSVVTTCHMASFKAGWWYDKEGNHLLVNPMTVPAKLMLCVTELSEAMEGHRRNLMDDKLPHRSMIEVELADALIRICDLAGALNLDLGGAVVEKIMFNASRADHKLDVRASENGKKY